MIEIPRSVLRHLRAVFRRLSRLSRHTGKSAVSLEAGPDGLRVRLHQASVQAEWFQPGAFAERNARHPA